MAKKTIEIEDGKVKRQFTSGWSSSGFINLDPLPKMVKSLVDQKNSMVEYIEALHDKIDKLIEINNLCDICGASNCQSDHK